MKRIGSIVMVIVLLLSFTQTAGAWGRWHHGYYRPYYGPVVRPYFAPPPVVVGRWIPPHYVRTPYGDRFVRGHYARPY